MKGRDPPVVVAAVFPDFNPMEHLWNKVKAILPVRAPRTANQLLWAAATAFEAISPADCQSFFLHAQYAMRN